MTTLLVIVSLSALTHPVAQQPLATVVGVAADSNGAVLPGVRIAATREGGPEAAVVTDTEGRFTLRLAAGSVTLSASLAGFRTAEKRVDLRPGESTTLDFTLCPGPLLFIDWIAAPEDLREFFAQAHTVAHIRVVGNDGRAGDCENAGALLTATILEQFKPAPSAGRTLTFRQEFWYSEPTPYPVGSELVVFLDQDRGKLVRSHGPSGVFLVGAGKVIESGFPHHRAYTNMPIGEFLAELRAMAGK